MSNDASNYQTGCQSEGELAIVLEVQVAHATAQAAVSKEDMPRRNSCLRVKLLYIMSQINRMSRVIMCSGRRHCELRTCTRYRGKITCYSSQLDNYLCPR